MGRDLNDAKLIGRLTRDVELRYSQSNTAIAKLSVAVNDSVKKDDTWQDAVDYFDIVVFGKQAENCSKYLVKGSQILVQGRLRQQRWEKDGKKHSKVEVVASFLQFLTKIGDNSNSDNNYINQDNNGYNQSNDDDLPPF